MKYNMHYKRFRHFGKDKVTLDFAFFAIAFDIKKMVATWQRQTRKHPYSPVLRAKMGLLDVKCSIITTFGTDCLRNAA